MTSSVRTFLGRGTAGRAVGQAVVWGVIGQALLVLSGVVAARALGVTARGQLALLALVPVALSQIGGLGLPLAFAYAASRSPASIRRIIAAIAMPAALQAAILVACHVVILRLVLASQGTDVAWAGLLTLVMIPVLTLHQYALAQLQALQQFGWFNFLQYLAAGLYAGGIAGLLIVDRARLVEVTAAWVTAWTAAAAIGVLLARAHMPPDRPSSEIISLRRMLRFGVAGLLGSSAPVERFRLDQVVVASVLPAASLGLYVVSLSFTSIIGFIARSVAAVGFTRVAAEPTPRGARRAVWRYFALIGAITLVVVIPLIVSADWLVPAFFGEEYLDAVPITRVLLMGVSLMAMRFVLSDLSRGAGFPAHGSVAEALFLASLAIALLVLVPEYGVVGVAWSLAASGAVSLVLAVILQAAAGRR